VLTAARGDCFVEAGKSFEVELQFKNTETLMYEEAMSNAAAHAGLQSRCSSNKM
jgi:hypothetical protein